MVNIQMNKIIYPLLIICLFACKAADKNTALEENIPKELTKLELLFLLPQDSSLTAYDLSKDSIVSFPDLSEYTIYNLDLSNNLLDTVILEYLPQKLEKLNLSYNHYKGNFRITQNTIPNLKEIDISYNNLNEIDIAEPLYRIIASHNDIKGIYLNHKNLYYLDISYNPNLPERVTFEPLKIDTVLHEGTANGKPLRGPFDPWWID